MAIKLKSNSAYDGQVQESNTAARQYYLPDNDSGLGTQLMTAQATTSGTNIDFNSIPSWVKRITVMFNGVSTSGTNIVQIQIGDGSVNTSGYLSAGSGITTASAAAALCTTGFPVDNVASSSAIAAAVRHGMVTLCHMGSNVWVAYGGVGHSDAAWVVIVGGSKTLAGTLDRVRITTVGGTDTFDAGSINVMYE